RRPRGTQAAGGPRVPGATDHGVVPGASRTDDCRYRVLLCRLGTGIHHLLCGHSRIVARGLGAAPAGRHERHGLATSSCAVLAVMSIPAECSTAALSWPRSPRRWRTG